jgi:chitin synthase
VFTNPGIVAGYSKSPETLHELMLLRLGEDRYLTSLIMDHLPRHRCLFVPWLSVSTDVPQTFRVLLSQRRRWQLSAVHNLWDNILLGRKVPFLIWILLVSGIISWWIAPALSVGFVLQIVPAALSGRYWMYGVMWGALFFFATLYLIVFGVKHKQYDVIPLIPVYVFGMLMFNIVFPVYAAWNCDQTGWGKTRMVDKEPPTERTRLVPLASSSWSINALSDAEGESGPLL